MLAPIIITMSYSQDLKSMLEDKWLIADEVMFNMNHFKFSI